MGWEHVGYRELAYGHAVSSVSVNVARPVKRWRRILCGT